MSNTSTENTLEPFAPLLWELPVEVGEGAPEPEPEVEPEVPLAVATGRVEVTTAAVEETVALAVPSSTVK